MILSHLNYLIFALAVMIVVAAPVLLLRFFKFIFTGLVYRPQIYTWAEDIEGHNEAFFIYRERWVKENKSTYRQDWWRAVKPLKILGGTYKNWHVHIGPWYQYNVGLSHAKTTTWPYQVVALSRSDLTSAEQEASSNIESLARVSSDQTTNHLDIVAGSPALLHDLARNNKLGFLPGQNGKPNTYVIILDENPAISAAVQEKLLALTQGRKD